MAILAQEEAMLLQAHVLKYVETDTGLPLKVAMILTCLMGTDVLVLVPSSWDLIVISR